MSQNVSIAYSHKCAVALDCHYYVLKVRFQCCIAVHVAFVTFKGIALCRENTV